MSGMELFNTDLSPFGHRVRIMLAEKGIDYTQTNIDLADRPQSFYAISPYGKVPTLRHGSDSVWNRLQSASISTRHFHCRQ
jgi:glutathione S-transferase